MLSEAYPLTLTTILRHGLANHGKSRVVSAVGDRYDELTFTEFGGRAEALASGLEALGVGRSDTVGTMCWNTQEHLEAYFAVPCMGAVLHTINIRLFPDQLAYTINHAADRALIIDATLLPLLHKVRDELHTVEQVIVVGGGDLPAGALRYEDVLARGGGTYTWPDDIVEGSPATVLYTTGTTGDPKGVAYTHRGQYLHAITECTTNSLGIGQRDRVFPIASMFHVNAWGLPHAAVLGGADIILPGRDVSPAALCRVIAEQRPTVTAAVPTIWNDVRSYGDVHPVDLSSLRIVVCGGAAVPRSLIEHFHTKYGLRVVQGWGMTENGSLALSQPPRQATDSDVVDWLARTGRVIAGIEIRVCAENGSTLPSDGSSVGEIEVRGSWVSRSYYRSDNPDCFHDGWLRTGDVGTVDPEGWVRLTDRTKDVIKSGGEWISSLAIEDELMAHPNVVEAAVIGVADDVWSERPLACVVRAQGANVTVEELCQHLDGAMPSWWIPDNWAFIDQVPRTSVGKFDKRTLRTRVAGGDLVITRLPSPRRRNAAVDRTS